MRGSSPTYYMPHSTFRLYAGLRLGSMILPPQKPRSSRQVRSTLKDHPARRVLRPVDGSVDRQNFRQRGRGSRNTKGAFHYILLAKAGHSLDRLAHYSSHFDFRLGVALYLLDDLLRALFFVRG